MPYGHAPYSALPYSTLPAAGGPPPTVTGDIAVTAAKGTALLQGRLVFRGTLVALASKGTAALAGREVFHGTVILQAARATATVGGRQVFHGSLVALAAPGRASITGTVTGGDEPPAALPPVIFGTDDWPRPFQLIEPPIPLRGLIRAKARPATARLRGTTVNPDPSFIEEDEALALMLLFIE